MITSAKIFSFSRQPILLYDIIVELTMHIPPKHKHLVNPSKQPKKEPDENPFVTLSEKKSKQTCRIDKKDILSRPDMHGCISVGEAMGGESRTLICTKCGSEMVVLAILQTLKKY